MQFYNPDLNRSVEGDLTEIAGGMQLIIGNTLYNGNIVSAEDSKGCVISREMAYRLFGTVHALGETLCMTRTIGEKQERAVYIVRGILNTKETKTVTAGDGLKRFGLYDSGRERTNVSLRTCIGKEYSFVCSETKACRFLSGRNKMVLGE